MKKLFIALILFFSVLLVAPTMANGETNEYVVGNFSELSTAVSKASNNYLTKIVVNGSINLEQDLTIKGKVTFIGSETSELVFENGSKKRTIRNSNNSDIRFENITIKRTVTDETEGFLFRFESKGTVWFSEVTFDVATLASVSTTYDRVTYVPNGVDVTIYFNDCTYNTEAYFYRGTMVFLNSDAVPSTAGSPTIKNFNELKIDYSTRTITYPSGIQVSEDSEFKTIVSSGSLFKSTTTYYASKDGYVFSFTTKNLKLDTPTLASVDVDYANEVINISDKFVVSLNAEFTNLLKSGDKVTPGMKLYIKQLAEGIFLESDVCEVTLPERPTVVKLESDFTCSFGFVMKYHENVEFSIGDEYQLSPVFTGLDSNTTYTVKMRVKATNSSFASEIYETTVKTN